MFEIEEDSIAEFDKYNYRHRHEGSSGDNEITSGIFSKVFNCVVNFCTMYVRPTYSDIIIVLISQVFTCKYIMTIQRIQCV